MTKFWPVGIILLIVLAVIATAPETSTTVTVPMDMSAIGGGGGGGVTQCLIGDDPENMTEVDCAQFEKMREAAIQEDWQNHMKMIEQQALDVHEMSTTIAYMGLIIPFGIIYLIIAFLVLIYVHLRTRGN